MTTATKSNVPENIYKPADIDAHQAEKDKWDEKHQKMRPELLKCLNASYASRKESQKELISFVIECELNEGKPGAWELRKYNEVIEAKNEKEAWAIFCDRRKQWPSPRDCGLKIKRAT